MVSGACMLVHRGRRCQVNVHLFSSGVLWYELPVTVTSTNTELPGAPEGGAPSPLAGVRVLDLSRVLSGPYAGRALADLGAEVVKVEPPEGDLTHLWGEVRNGQSGFFFQQNVGKQGIAVDLKVDGAADLIRRLAGVADVVIENFRPGVASRLGIGWPELSADNPKLVMLSISGFGQDEPPPTRAAFAAVIHAASGLIDRQARRDGCRPTDPMLSIADLVAGLHGTIAVLAALHLVRMGGDGQHIDLSMMDAMLATDEYSHHYLDGSPVARLGGTVWASAEGDVLIAADDRHTWIRLAATYGLDEGCPPGTPVAEKIAARRRLMTEWMAAQPKPELHAALRAAGLLSHDIVEPVEALQTTIEQRGNVADVDAGDGGTRRVLQLPYRFSGARSEVRGPAPRLGEHNRSVLRSWLDFDDGDIDALEAAAILVSGERHPTS